MKCEKEAVVAGRTITCLSFVFDYIRWMENVSLEVVATCFHPAGIRGQRVQDVSVFTSCPEKGSPPDKTVETHKPPKLEKEKPKRVKSPLLKVRPVTPKSKSHKLSKTPQVKVVAIKVTKNKKNKSNKVTKSTIF